MASKGFGAARALGPVIGRTVGRLLSKEADAAAEEVAGAACGLSFAPSTPVATPSGEQPIASLHVGDPVTAYDPSTGTTSTQTVQHVFINHDTDLLDVTLQSMAPSSTAPDATGLAKPREAALAAHGLRAPPLPATGANREALAKPAVAPSSARETIHTTANHPWLSADRGWTLAGALQLGEPVLRADGGIAIVVALRVVSGAAPMWDLTVSQVHTFAVGSGKYVVHNCGMGDEGLAKIARQIHSEFRSAFNAAFGRNARRSVVAVAEDGNGGLVASINNSVFRGKLGGDALDVFRGVLAGRGITMANRGFLEDGLIRPGVSVHAEDILDSFLGGGGARSVGTSWKQAGSFFCSRCQSVVQHLLAR